MNMKPHPCPMTQLTKLDAIRYAKELTDRDGRKYVVREDDGKFYVVPLYELGREGLTRDAGYATLGLLVKESL